MIQRLLKFAACLCFKCMCVCLRCVCVCVQSTMVDGCVHLYILARLPLHTKMSFLYIYFVGPSNVHLQYKDWALNVNCPVWIQRPLLLFNGDKKIKFWSAFDVNCLVTIHIFLTTQLIFIFALTIRKYTPDKYNICQKSIRNPEFPLQLQLSIKCLPV